MASGFSPVDEVEKRLKKLPEYKDLLCESLARDLAVREDFKRVYFESTINYFAGEALSGLKGGEVESFTSLEKAKHRERDQFDFANALDMTVQLHLTQLKRTVPFAGILSNALKFEYGPLHASIQVDDLILEWNDSNLVIPHWAGAEPLWDDALFKANIAGEGEWHDRAERLMSMANKTQDVEKKVEMLLSAATQKADVIDNLVRVVIRYNTREHFHVFKCNCQHFVQDVMAALKITEKPQFGGMLGEYFEALKRNKTPSLRARFSSHQELDSYVKEHFPRLSQHDCEYLLCIYNRFHLESMRAFPDQLEMWVCPVRSCQMERLDRHIAKKELLFHRFKQRQAKAIAHHKPPVIPPELQRNVDVFAQRNALSKFSQHGYQHKVTTKLKASREFRYESKSQLALISELLSEHEKLRQRYFSELVEGVSESAFLESSTEKLPEKEAMERSLDLVSKFPVKLVIHPIAERPQRCSTLLDQPVHSLASLQVGDIFLRWDEESLVVPSFMDPQPSLKNDLNSVSQWKAFIDAKQDDISTAVEELDQAIQVDVVYDLTTKKDRLLAGLIAAIVKYNRSKTHHSRRCNNYHFISDALKALEVKCPDFLNTSLRQYFKALKKKRDDSIPGVFASHAELDAYVTQSGGAELLGEAGLAHLLAAYFQFHLMDCCAARGREKWSCRVPSCRVDTLA